MPETSSWRQLRRRAWRASRAKRTRVEKTVLIKPPVATPSRRPTPWLSDRMLGATAVELLRSVPASQFVIPLGRRLDELLSMPGHLDLFSGCRIAAQKLADRSGRWVLCYDLKHSPAEDLLDAGVQQFLSKCVEAKAFLSATAGPVCSSFSRAVCPAVRTRDQPTGVDHMTDSMRKKVEIGNDMAVWLAGFIESCLLAGLKVWVENPAGSFLWLHPRWVSLIHRYRLKFFQTDYCRWGTPWRKRTKFYGNCIEADERLNCTCTQKHIQLRGYSHSHRVSWTKAAESYPPRLAAFLGAMVVEALKPIGRQRKLDAASCARSAARRIGEAQNPGPRQRLPRTDIPDLERINLVQPATQILQQRIHSRYIAWLENELGSAVLDRFVRNPSLQIYFVRAFGNWLYQTGEPMYLFRHLVVYLQQRFPEFRPSLITSWDLLARWEIALPVVHRPPMPKLILDAFAALGLCWGWHKWVTLTLVAFHGAIRISEPLKATRGDLLLPSDSGIDREVMFLRVGAPKPGRRGRGKVQHTRITDKMTVQLAVRFFSHLSADELLYPVAPSTYRRRWDRLLEVLEIDSSVRLTPGSLRPGGCVHWYHNDTPVGDILWRMRLRHMATLDHYLQEVGAMNVMMQISPAARRRVQSCSQMLPFIAQSLTT